MKQEDIQAIQQLLSTPKKVAIIPHRSPDGDAMGSTLGLYHFLLKLNHEPIVIAPNEFPEFLVWLPGSEKVLIFEKNNLTNSDLKWFLVTGFCGGFTTFSTFGYENSQLFQNQNAGIAFLYIGTSIIVGLASVWFGLFMTKL